MGNFLHTEVIKEHRILLGSSDLQVQRHISSMLPDSVQMVCADVPNAWLEELCNRSFDAVGLDIGGGSLANWDAIESVRSRDPWVPLFIIGEPQSYDVMARCFEIGAVQYICKTRSVDEQCGAFATAISRCLSQSGIRRQAAAARARIYRRAKGQDELLGQSDAMRAIKRQIHQFRHADMAALIQGPTGAGKELVAKSIHNNSPYGEGPFNAINAARFQPQLVSSELFGHEKGAFTGADRRRLGAFEASEGGTLFLDEIGELPLDIQGQLLRVLETKEVRPVGSERTIRVHVRVVAATNRDLDRMAADGEFRLDLLQRLSGIRYKIPPLIDRLDDLRALAQSFLAIAAAGHPSGRDYYFSGDAFDALGEYSWPGNVRELKNLVQRLVHLTMDDEISGDLIREELQLKSATTTQDLQNRKPIRARLQRFEMDCVREILNACDGNIRRAAEVAGEPLSTFHRRVKKLKESDFINGIDALQNSGGLA